MVAIPAEWRHAGVAPPVPASRTPDRIAAAVAVVPAAPIGLLRGIFWGLSLTAAAAVAGLFLGNVWAFLSVLGERWLARVG